jgi:hypothetical protein
MKKIWNFLRQHLREDFNAGHYILVALFLTAAIYFNYKFDYEDTVIRSKQGFEKVLFYFLFYGVSYYFASLSYLFFSKKLYVLVEADFWIKSVLAILLLAFDGSALFIRDMVNSFLDPSMQFWGYKVSINLMSFVVIVLPLIIFYRFYEKESKNCYGLTAFKFDYSPYVIMLLIMIPLIAAASFDQSFLRQYPMYKTSGAHIEMGVDEWVTTAAYETAYALDFVTVEFLFRGFMVIALMSTLGRGAVLSMAVTYCFLHFGKPPAEAISSIFGGYLLGVIAYETRSIWGGIILHMGIALSMEFAAYLQKTINV